MKSCDSPSRICVISFTHRSAESHAFIHPVKPSRNHRASALRGALDGLPQARSLNGHMCSGAHAPAGALGALRMWHGLRAKGRYCVASSAQICCCGLSLRSLSIRVITTPGSMRAYSSSHTQPAYQRWASRREGRGARGSWPSGRLGRPPPPPCCLMRDIAH
jgi:hypothetical protein